MVVVDDKGKVFGSRWNLIDLMIVVFVVTMVCTTVRTVSTQVKTTRVKVAEANAIKAIAPDPGQAIVETHTKEMNKLRDEHERKSIMLNYRQKRERALWGIEREKRYQDGITYGYKVRLEKEE